MHRSRSMESLKMLPEEAKLAVCLLRLTLSEDKKSPAESEFQSYIGKHHQFPYHKTVQLTPPKKSESKMKRVNSLNSHRRTTVNHPKKHQYAHQPVQRCKSSPPVTCHATLKTPPSDTPLTPSALNRLGESAPTESHGFFQKIIPNFLRRRSSSCTTCTSKVESTASVTTPNDVAMFLSSRSRQFSMDSDEIKYRQEHGCHFSGQFERDSEIMNNLILMSIR